MRRRGGSESVERPEEDALDDEALAVRARDDGDAFKLLYLRYYDGIFSLAMRWLRDRVEADDATSDIFFKALRNIRSFRGGSFRAWLYTIAVNTLRDRSKRERTVRMPQTPLIDARPGPEREAIARIAADELIEQLSELPVDVAVTVIMRAHDHNVADVAREVGRSEAWVRTTHYRTVRRLAARLQSANPDEVNRER